MMVWFDPGRMHYVDCLRYLVPIAGPTSVPDHKPRRFKRSQRKAKR